MEYRVVHAQTGRTEATMLADDASSAAAQFMDTLPAWEANVAYNYDRSGRRAQRVIIFDDIDDNHPPVFVVRRKNDKRRAKR